MIRVLIIDDDKGICYTLSRMIKNVGYDVTSINTLREGIQEVIYGKFDIVFLDVQMPDGNGLKQMPTIMDAPSKPEVIIMTGQGNQDGAELAVRNGAWDYIEKSASINEIKLAFVRAVQYREEKKIVTPTIVLKREEIVGNSPKIRACLDYMAQIGNSDGNVLISGETGTGKELFAQAIHANSPRSNNDLVVVDCAALPGTLVESTLFGYGKGAFTGADKAMDGLIKHADGGTLMLDEVGELPLSSQKTLLRVLQEKRFRPVGSKKEVKSNFRVLSLTNRNLDHMVKEGKFRSDLLFRLRTFSLKLPPLRKRQEDIRLLAMHYMTKLSERYSTGTKGFSPEFIEALNLYTWPGNVRELVNALDRALAVLGLEPTLFPKHLPNSIRVKLARGRVFTKTPSENLQEENTESLQPFPKLHEFRNKALAQLEQQYLMNLISHSNGIVKEACITSGLGKSRLYELLKKYNLNL